MKGWPLLLSWLTLATAAAIATCGLIALLIGWLRANAVAKVTSRSSHVAETPESAGVALVPMALLSAAVALCIFSIPWPYSGWYGALVCVAALALTVMGFIDDARGLTSGIRLAAQFICVSAVVVVLP